MCVLAANPCPFALITSLAAQWSPCAKTDHISSIDISIYLSVYAHAPPSAFSPAQQTPVQPLGSSLEDSASWNPSMIPPQHEPLQ